jgi:2-methylisocitrate lyase-like PEP mutase family enzyme
MTPIERFRELHNEGVFVMPNPYDVGTARVLAVLGFPALATTSSGFAATLGRLDMTVSRDEMLAHVAVMAAATDLPLNADSERCFGDDPAGVEDTVDRIGQAGAAGCSIEDWNPDTGAIDPLEVATERVRAAAASAARHGLVLTARCENHLHGFDDLDDSIRRLVAYRDAGADVVYAPGLVDLGQIRRVVEEVGVPVNVLLRPGGPTVGQLGDVGVRRISVGGTLARIALGALADAARHVLDDGQYAPDEPALDGRLAATAFGPPTDR